MKRDMDLIRTLLMQVEAAPANQDTNNTELSAEGYSQDEIDYHVHLLEDAGFIDSLPAHSMSGKHWIIQGLPGVVTGSLIPHEMTPSGHASRSRSNQGWLRAI